MHDLNHVTRTFTKFLVLLPPGVVQQNLQVQMFRFVSPQAVRVPAQSNAMHPM